MMFINYFTVALRNLLRHKGYSLINILGLAIGLASCILILLYVQDEVGYDRYHLKADRIYRVAYEMASGDQVWRTARTPHPLAPALRNAFPEIQETVRFRQFEPVIQYGDKRFKEERFYYADAAVFTVFSFPFIEGDPKTALVDPFSMVITEAAAQKYFGSENPISKVVTVQGVGDLEITGVLKDIPKHSHFTFDFLTSYTTLQALRVNDLQQWDTAVTSTYLLLSPGEEAGRLEAKLNTLVPEYLSEEEARNRFYLHPLTDIYLYSHLSGDLGTHSEARYIYLFSSIALFILLVACINFMNLTTARATDRTCEIGMRKVFGAYRSQLMRQFLGESILMVYAALVCALVLVEIALPSFNTLAGKQLTMPYGNHPLLVPGLFGFGSGLGLLAGSYPAFILSRFLPIQVLYNQTTPVVTGSRLRQGLVVFQFGIAIVFITATMLMSHQIDYVRSKDLGFNQEQVVVIPMQNQSMQSQYESVKNELLKHPGILGATACYHTPGRGLGFYGARVEGIDEELTLPTYIVDYNFIPTLGMKMVEGRNFSTAFATDAGAAFIVNETAVKHFGWDKPIGRQVDWDYGTKTGAVIGVVKDFHFASLHDEIQPLMMHIAPTYFRYLAVRLKPGNIPATLSSIKKIYQLFDPVYPFEYTFLDQDFNRHYHFEQRTAQMVTCASILAILIACLGLFGLVSLMTRQRTREIGVRKVLGATVPDIVALLSKDFIRLILLASVVAMPIAYYAINRWLQSFAYRIDVGVGTFIGGGVLVLVIALLTISYQAIKAARANPVDTLRYE